MATSNSSGSTPVRPSKIALLVLLASFFSLPVWGSTYYLSPNGSDTNSGTSTASPWESPNHSLSCGDTIVAASGTYSAGMFQSGKWGTVNCSRNNNVAWLRCSRFDTCKIDAGSGQFGMYVDKNYWGVQGWEVTVRSGGYSCFAAAPNQSRPTTIHHIIFADDIANGCQGGGFSTFNTGTASVDYIVMVGNIAYNAAQGNLHCYSGISIYQPQQSDSAAGTHIYVSGNFSYGNVNPSTCQGTAPTDGEGLIFDTFDGTQGSFPGPYLAQAVQANNILFANGGRGSQVENNSAGAKHALIYRYNNTLWGNSTDQRQNTALCADMVVNKGQNIKDSKNIVETTSGMSCGGNYLYDYYVYAGGSSDAAQSNWLYSPSNLSQGSWASSGYSFQSNNVLGSNPQFRHPTDVSAPSCAASGSVTSCMGTVVANFTPQNNSAKSYGYQNPNTSAKDTLFPSWVCNANLPSGLVAANCN